MANHKQAGHHLSSALAANKQQNIKLARHHIGHALNALNDRISGSSPVAKPPVAPEIEGGEPNDSPIEEQGEYAAPQPFAAKPAAKPAANGGGNLMARLRSVSKKPY